MVSHQLPVRAAEGAAGRESSSPNPTTCFSLTAVCVSLFETWEWRSISRPRPCQIDQTFALLVARPSSSSFPSTHSAWAFGAATAIFMRHRKLGAAAYAVAALIAFSRMYMFLHFPTDVLFGAAMGMALGVLAHWIMKTLWKKLDRGEST